MDNGLLMVITGYLDESYDGKDAPDNFTLSCIMTSADDWKKITDDWRELFRGVNADLASHGRRQIARYKAAECNGSTGDFEGWTASEKMALTERMFAIFERVDIKLTVMAYSVRLSKIHVKLPSVRDPKAFAYAMLFLLVIKGVLKMMHSLEDGSSISFLWDQCDYDLVYQCVFNTVLTQIRNDPDVKMLTTAAPLANVNCPPLEVADLMAYENFKHHLNQSRGNPRKRTLDYMLQNGILGGRSSVLKDEDFEIPDLHLRFLKWCSSFGGKKLRYPEIDALT